VTAAHGAVPLELLLDTGRFDMEAAQSSAAWVRELEGVHTPETEEFGIGSLLFSAREPFHPERLWRHLHEGDWSRVIRSKGFFWIATRPGFAYAWSQAGGACGYHVAGRWWADVPRGDWPGDPGARAEILEDWDPRYGDRQQQLVLIGRDLDRAALREALERCLCTEEELAGGVGATLADPFPAERLTAGTAA